MIGRTARTRGRRCRIGSANRIKGELTAVVFEPRNNHTARLLFLNDGFRDLLQGHPMAKRCRKRRNVCHSVVISRFEKLYGAHKKFGTVYQEWVRWELLYCADEELCGLWEGSICRRSHRLSQDKASPSGMGRWGVVWQSVAGTFYVFVLKWNDAQLVERLR